MTVSTPQVLAERALQRSCGKSCVDWAIGLLEAGRDSDAVCRLAAQLPPYNHFELASLRDHVLSELGLLDTSVDEAFLMYSAQLLQAGIDGTMPMDASIAAVKDLCIANDYQSDIYDFYLLHFARADLREQNVQYYYPGANGENIEDVCRGRIVEFLAEYGSRQNMGL